MTKSKITKPIIEQNLPPKQANSQPLRQHHCCYFHPLTQTQILIQICHFRSHLNHQQQGPAPFVKKKDHPWTKKHMHGTHKGMESKRAAPRSEDAGRVYKMIRSGTTVLYMLPPEKGKSAQK